VEKKSVICIGAALIDESFTCLSAPLHGTSNPAAFHQSPGGVACNIAGHLSLLGHQVELISHFGNDSDGKWLMGECEKKGTGLSHSVVNDSPTGKYMALLSPEGELFAGAAAGHIETEITPAFLQNKISTLKQASLILLDCNLSIESLNWLLSFSYDEKINCIIEPVSIRKAMKLSNSNLKNVLLISPNNDELAALAGEKDQSDQNKLIDQLLSRGIKYLWIRNGKDGSQIYSTKSKIEIPAPNVKVVDITGAGDAALAGWIHGWLLNKNADECLRYGHAMASIILQVKGAVIKNLNSEILESAFQNNK
jgi:pseudouridine kinase